MTPAQLARVLEQTELSASAGCLETLQRARPGGDAVAEDLCGGRAFFYGAGSPLSQALGVGMNGPVIPAEVERLMAFFQSRGSPVVISLCPFADRTLIESIAGRGFRISHFEHTMVRSLELASDRPAIEVAAVPGPESQSWADLVMRGFADGADPSPDMVETFLDLNAVSGSGAYVARLDGQAAGGAWASFNGPAALFAGDATLPAFRGRGVQKALIAHRLWEARQRGCELAMACTLPGSVSERNYTRAGFQVAYTKTMLVQDGR